MDRRREGGALPLFLEGRPSHARPEIKQQWIDALNEKLHPLFGSELVRAVGALFTGSTLQSVEVLGSKQHEFALAAAGNGDWIPKGGFDNCARFVAEFGSAASLKLEERRCGSQHARGPERAVLRTALPPQLPAAGESNVPSKKSSRFATSSLAS
jgi:hypothetical protein